MARFNVPKKDGYLCAGVITQAHNLHGEVLVKFLLDDESLMAKGLVLETIDDKTMTIEKARPSNKGLLVKFAEVKNRNEAEKSRKTYLYISTDMLPQEDEDEIYYFELKEFDVLDESNNVLGRVLSAFDGGANTILEVKLANPIETEEKKVTKVLIPFSKDMILSINKEGLELTADAELFEMYVNL